MKIDTIKNGGYSQGGLDNSGGTLTGPLLLSRHPQLPMEAVTKQYVDQGVQNLDAGNFTTGTLPIARLPVMGGDVTSEAGSNLMSLAPTGVTAGEYARITVNAKGRAIGTGIISANDLPALPFSKITMDKPTTLSGYGITDAVSNAGGIMTGPLILAGNPTNGDHLVPKQYIDGMINSLSSARTGDVVRKAYPTTPVGFLKCNGAEVSKTIYSDLYAIVGDSNTSFNMIGSGQPWRQQYEINSAQSTEITGWTTGTALPASVCYASVFVTKNRVYLCGGSNVTSAIATVYTAPINTDGTLGAWSTGTSLPAALHHSQGIITKNRVYLLGGENSSGSVTNIVYTAQINSDGTLGSWVTDTSLPINLHFPATFVTKTKVYLCGGSNGTNLLDTIYSAPINADGTIGVWSLESNTIPASIYYPQAVTIKNKVYILGGMNSSGSAVNTVYTAAINTDGTLGSWTIGTSLPGVITHSTSVVTKNCIYILGGYTTTYSSTVYYASINVDGTIGTWVTGSSLPGIVTGSSVIITNSKIYLLGTRTSSSTITSAVYVGNFSGGLNDYSNYYEDNVNNYLMPGSGRPWQQQYQFNNSQNGDITGWSNSGSLPAALSASQAIVTKNRVYLLGGINSSENNVSTVYTAPINSDGTLGAWTTTTSLPDVVSRAQAVVTKNRVYLMGGHRNSAIVSTVYTAPINSDGTLGAWTTSSNLPGNLALSTSIVTKNRVYLLGGSTNASTGTSTVYTASINTDGTLGTWTTATSLPGSLGWSQAVVTKNRVYLLGGWTSLAVSTVYTAPINSDGNIGTWSTGTALPAALHWVQVFVTKNRVYILGGWNNTNVINTTYSAPILNDGTLGTWVAGTALLTTNAVSQCIVVNNKIHLLGGRNEASSVVANIYTATIAEGLNDYSPYYDGTVVPFEPVNPTTTFKLPDMSATDVNGIYHYIKF